MRGNGTDRQFFMKLHRASSLHYDFRLEHEGALKSWVIPDGPCLDPTQRRPAKLVADHEVKYGSLERVIPAGQYGAGPVLLWDYGIWLPCQDVSPALVDGRLVFHLLGTKLKGLWSLIRVPVRSAVKGMNWLLTKERDSEARSLSEMDIVFEMPKSVLTGRTLDEVAAEPNRFVSAKTNSPTTARNHLLLPFDDIGPQLSLPSKMASDK